VTGTVSYVVDCSSYQGSPDWGRVAAICAGGAEKVSEGTSYANPRWAAAKPAMRAAAAHGFVPMAYLFMDAVSAGDAQARYFASLAGDMTGWGVVIDFEHAPNGSPTLAQAGACAAELRSIYPGTPIGGYCPHWYTGGESLAFCDWLWASEYVSGHGDPAMLYSQVPASWWAPYGGRSPLLLQFTSQGSVAGIAGAVDCSAFHGDAAALASHVLRRPAPLPPSPAAAERTLTEGATGSAVRTLQSRLNAWGAHLVVDGRFGVATWSAVRAFQAARKITVDGIAGPQTWAALLRVPSAR
jgi:GH25 family lysozyme M1 (1,4-beta-N-acetylmuramidase)